MPISPNSVAHLLGVPLGENQKHQIRFANSDSQYTYFYSKKKHSVTTGCKYIKGMDDVFTVPFCKDDIIVCNYIMYKNTAYGSRWFYGFITNIEYVNDGASNITIKTDVYQTWLFDVTLKYSHVERYHMNVAYDHIGNIPTTDEDLNVGDYINSDRWHIDSGNNLSIIVAATAGAAGVQYATAKYAGVVSGYTFFAFDNDTTGVTALQTWVSSLTNDEVIGFVFLVPRYAVPSYANGSPIASCDANIQEITKVITFDTIDGYTPKNQKLFMYPYNFLYATTNNGVNAIYKYELFDIIWSELTGTFKFQLAANLAVEARVQVAPKAYKGATPNYDESITLDGFPQCSWRSDFYKSWLSTNGLSQALSVAGSAVALAGGIASMNPLAIAAGGVGIAESIGGFQKASVQPDNVKGGNNGSINAAVGNLNITFYQRHVDRHHAEIIDDYFEMYGYKSNEMMYIPVYTRKYWNYIKTLGICITGDIPPEDMNDLKSIYDNGVTLWHNNGDYFMDYTRNNHEVIS